MAEDNSLSSPKKPNSRIVRYEDLRPCFDAFIDTRTPGSDKKENFTIIGPGVSENPNQFVHIAEPHGFNIGGARQPPGCLNSQHSHETVEVFFVHSGTWSFDLGEHANDANITLRPGDIISIPTQVFRGFKNIGDDIGYLWAVLGQDDPGKVLWAPDVFEMARDYGLVLLENGMLVDIMKGETVPEGARTMPVTSAAQIAKLNRFTTKQLRACCILSNENVGAVNDNGYAKRPLIGPEAKLNWQHGFRVDEIVLPAGARYEGIEYAGAEVVFVHRGQLSICVGQENWILNAGDTATLPKRASRTYSSASEGTVDFLRVRGDI